jgi:hypothetical protein
MKNYVTEYMGHKVPEGATHYQPNCEFYNEAFWDKDNNIWIIGIVFKWLPSKMKPFNLIELPEAEWEPVTGEECEYSQSPINAKCKNWHKDIFIYKHGDLVWLSGGGIITTKNLNFRPLSSVEELEREEFIRLALYHCYNGLESGNMAAAMFDAGFTAPKEAK